MKKTKPKKKVKTKLKKIRLPEKVWLVLMGFLGILFIFSTYTTIAAYQVPTISDESYVRLSYSNSGKYDYVVNLENNTVYNKTELSPGEGIIFKQIVIDINASMTYSFQIDSTADISGTYYIQAIIQTDLWTKFYTVVPTTSFSTSGRVGRFEQHFPIDFTFYDSVVTIINSEIGINAPNPILIIKCPISLNAKTSDTTIYESFEPEITVSLNQKTIEFSDILSIQKTGSRSGTRQVFHQEVVDNRENWVGITVVFLGVLLFLFFATKGESVVISKQEILLRRIQKKYGEWMVETKAKPVRPNTKIIPVNSLDDLSKVGEELGKPILHYISEFNNDSYHSFYVVDESAAYEYIFKTETIVKNQVFCPKCGIDVYLRGIPGEKVEASCPQCEYKGFVEIQSTEKTDPVHKMISMLKK